MPVSETGDTQGRLTSKPCVLFVDNEFAARAAFAKCVRSAGFEVETVASGKEAIERAVHIPYAVIAADGSMPGIDGVSLIRRLRPIQPAAIYLMVVDQPESETFRAQFDTGPDVAVLCKPWDRCELIETIRRAIERYRGTTTKPIRVPEARTSILIIEDNRGDALLVRTYLTETRLHLETVAHVDRLADALDRVTKEKFDVVLCDLNLPDSWGLDTLRSLQMATKDAAVIVLSGMDDDALGAEAVQIGAQDYLSKGRVDAHNLERSIRYATERKRTQRRLAYLAHHDDLTGLPNRTAFAERVGQAIARAERHGTRAGIMFLDLDRFKTINDSLGHSAGDHVLGVVAGRVTTAVRDSDAIARLGGDEFGILLEDLTDSTAAVEVAERVLASLAAPICVGGGDLVVTTSIGVAIYPEDGQSVQRLLKAADDGMYAAKASGGNTYRFATQTETQPALSRLELERDLLRAVERQEFELYFQPQVSLETRRVEGYEALLRWQRCNGQRIKPEQVVPVLEELGLIHRVGEWVLQTACRQLKEWREAGARHLRIAVNISPRQFNQANLVDTVERTLDEVGLEPRSLELEITESLLMRDTERTRRALGELKALGVRLAVDDFGTGYSSLSYLERFAVDALKIDQSFIRGAPASRRRAAITGAILGLGHGLGLEVVAEGVETEDELRYLKGEGCDLAQGFLLGAPGPTWETPATPPSFRVELRN